MAANVVVAAARHAATPLAACAAVNCVTGFLVRNPPFRQETILSAKGISRQKWGEPRLDL
jgi:hypothetical protein